MAQSQPREIISYYDNDEEKGIARCKICKRNFKNNRMHNLKRHLLKAHQIEDIQSTTKENLSLVQRCKKVKVAITKQKLLRSCIGLVTEDSVPFNVLDSKNMRSILDPICEGLGDLLGKKFRLNSHNCKKYVNLVADGIKNNIKAEAQNKLISLKIDSAKRQARNIFGISAQFIKDDTIQSRILGMVELKGASSSKSEPLATEILTTLNKYGINLNQIVSITSDNGANMLKATKILSYCSRFGEDEESDGGDNENDVYIRNISLYEHDSKERLGNIEMCRCAAHTAQLCALDVTKNKDIKVHLLNCRNLVKFLRKSSNGYKDIFAFKKQRLPQLDCPTRWGSTYNMIADLLSAKSSLETVESVQNKSDDDDFEISESLWNFVDCYNSALSPLQTTIIKFQEEQLHYGDFYAQWLKCKLFTQLIAEENCDSVGNLKYKIANILLESIEKRTTKLLENEGANACLFMDPRFHHTLRGEKRAEATKYLKKIWDKVKALNSKEITSSADVNTALDRDDMDIGEQILTSFLSGQIQHSGRASIDVYLKIENLNLPFLRSDTNVLSFWKEKKFEEPELYALSNVCFAIPPTQNSETGEVTYMQSDAAKIQQTNYDAETGEPIAGELRVRYLKQKNFHIPKKLLRGSPCEEFEKQMLGRTDEIYHEPTAKISKESKKPTAKEKTTKRKTYNRDTFMNMEGVSNDIILAYNKSNYRLLLLPTVFCFNIYAALVVSLLEIFFHCWSHCKNGINMNKDVYYRSPLHVITSQFCAKCRSESEMEESIFRDLNIQMRAAHKSQTLKDVTKAIG